MRLEPFATLNDMRKQHGIRKTILIKVDESVERFTAGLRINDIRGVLRGDPPGKPNPRVKPHTEGAWFHIWPTFYHEAVTKFYPTFKLGMITTIFFIIEIITGLFLMLYYTPAPGISYNDMLRILSNVPLGQFVRDIHRLAAEGMVIAVWLHMGRTFLTGSYKKPRQFTWATGAILLVLTIGLSYSGYLLPWDQLAYWAVTIGASMADAAVPPEVGKAVGLLLRGAPDLGAGGLLRFYLLHVFAFPLLAIIFVFVHYYKVIRHGHSLPPEMENIGEDNARKVSPDKRVPFLPDIFTNELLWFVFIVAAMVVPIALNIYHAPLEHAANPQNTPLHTIAPWYFLFLQGWLKLGDKTIWGFIVPLVILLPLLIVWPYLDYNPSRRYGDRKLALMAMMIVIGILVVSSYMGTPGYGVVTAPQIEVGFNALPPEKPGPLRSVPFDQLVPGTWSTFNLSGIPDNAPELKVVMDEIALEIDRAPKSIISNGVEVTYANMRADLIIEDMQSDANGPNLKHLTLVVHWDGEPLDPVRGTPGYYLDTFVHKNSNYVAGGE
jgi:quinol-cytochrome oxidoreductase complex cytochrome b subunit